MYESCFMTRPNKEIWYFIAHISAFMHGLQLMIPLETLLTSLPSSFVFFPFLNLNEKVRTHNKNLQKKLGGLKKAVGSAYKRTESERKPLDTDRIVIV